MKSNIRKGRPNHQGTKKMEESELDKIASKIVNAAFDVHKEIGPGLLESVYQICLIKELKNRGLKVESQVIVPVVYKGEILSKDFYR